MSDQRNSKPGPGKPVALVAPASPFEADRTKRARRSCATPDTRWFPARISSKGEGYLAGTDRDRLQDLTEAVLDPEIEAIICIRGGYGSGRLLPQFRFPASEQPETFHRPQRHHFFASWSDELAGWTTFHGPNLIGMSETPQKAAKRPQGPVGRGFIRMERWSPSRS